MAGDRELFGLVWEAKTSLAVSLKSHLIRGISQNI